ncbi:MAG: FIST N-terminal domain-containing protein [Holophaga sp.]|nr:FIST N-terminal domain-containing protein [Holophaga sp.]
MPFKVLQGMSTAAGASAAVAEIVRQIGGADLDGVFLFCSPRYDLQLVGQELKRSFACPVIACSSSGQIGPGGFQRGGMTALSFSGGYLQVRPHLIHPLADYQEQVAGLAAAFREAVPHPASSHAFGFLVIDGMSMMEEQVASALYQALDNVPIIGGSAGDDLRFEQTQVYWDGRFLSDAAVLAACRARGPVVPFMLKHFVPSDINLVITDADPEQRIIREFNGEPAAEVYAEAIGAQVGQLNPNVFSSHPLLLGIGGDHYVRSIARVNPDLSLTLYCAIETGLVVTLGKGVDALKALDQAFASVLDQVPEPIAILACDCILRRLEFENLGIDREVGDFFARRKVFGFSTYGEQINGLHVNQTLTGIALGRGGGA